MKRFVCPACKLTNEYGLVHCNICDKIICMNCSRGSPIGQVCGDNEECRELAFEQHKLSMAAAAMEDLTAQHKQEGWVNLNDLCPWVVDPCPDANGNWTIRVDDGSENGNTEREPIATAYSRSSADTIVADHTYGDRM